MDMGVVDQHLAAISAARAAEDKEATDAALSELWYSLPETKERGDIFADLTGGLTTQDFVMAPPANEMARPEGVPPEAKQVKGKKSGRTYWAIPDGNGGWQEIDLGATG